MKMDVMSTNLPQKMSPDKSVPGTTLFSPTYFPGSSKPRWKPATTREGHTSRWNMANVTPVQVRRNRAPKPVKLTVYADMITVQATDADRGLTEKSTDYQSRGIRGNVAGFSHASRKRMIETMARIRHAGKILFLTMTYDDRSWLRENCDMKAEFEAFRKRFERAFPSWSGLWRVELQERKSGLLIGHTVPHLHMLIFVKNEYENTDIQVLSDSFMSWGSAAWQEITGSDDPNHLIYGFHVKPVTNRRHAQYYVSKYVGKIAEDGYEIGRRWGRIGQLDCSESEQFILSEDEHDIFKRLVKRWLASRKSSFKSRFKSLGMFTKYTVFGLGDTGASGGVIDAFPDVWLMVDCARRIAGRRNQRLREIAD